MPMNHAHLRRLAPTPARPKRELTSILDLMPSSLELLSAASMARQGIELLSNAANGRRFVSVLTSMQSHLRAANVSVLVTEPREAPELLNPEELSRSQRRWLGQLALELYFAQLFRSEVAVVDLWPSRLGVDAAGDAVWSPRPFYLRWDPRFRDALCDIYAGLFLSDADRFELGVAELGLGSPAKALVEHFGDSNQRSVRFGSTELRRTLIAMSKERSDSDRRLHPNFVAFGLYLSSLHGLLESLDMAFDVRAAFMRAYPGSSQR
ncbi:MAG: hypothetical protein JSV06_07525 [Myxococcales bacterium]|nr:MAG: hypothetical protein JSV06_07525 [Myxococcales bacterium]